jgi:phosphate starvation-inducible PhoH-like protein
MARKGEKPPLPTPKNNTQKTYVNAIKTYPMVVSLGPAGTGKSFLAAAYAAYYLKDKKIDKIILTRPTVPTGRSIGHFPGTLEEKMDPWCKPILLTLQQFLGKGDYDCQVKNGNIEIVPFETIRGRSFDNAFVILDEAQNCTYDEIKAFVTRSGENCTTLINGDVTQSDLGRSDNGLSAIVEMLRYSKRLSKFVALVEFTSEDIVRSGLCQLWVQEFEKEDTYRTLATLGPTHRLRVRIPYDAALGVLED